MDRHINPTQRQGDIDD